MVLDSLGLTIINLERARADAYDLHVPPPVASAAREAVRRNSPTTTSRLPRRC
jgi:hypothetical protein